jgi:hypothetical protein
MIRSLQTGAQFSFGRRMGAVTTSLQFNPITAGIGAGVSLATTAAALWMNSIQTSHDAMTATTLIVNGLAEQLQNLNDAYFAETNPSCADQRAALDAYDSAWAWLQSPAACGGSHFGSAGNACITDRAPGGRWPWKVYYRDPIANDPRMVGLGCDTGMSVFLPSITTGGYGNTGITSTGGSSTTGANAADIAAAAVAATGTAAPAATPVYFSASPSATVLPGIPNNYLWIAAAGFGALLLAKSL